jgi:hypothetical protein
MGAAGMGAAAMTDLGQSEASEIAFRSLMRQAEEKVLHVSPPYSSAKAREAFLQGYETALRDLSRGWLTMPETTEVD